MYAARPRKPLLIGEVVKSRVHPGDGDCTLKIEDIVSRSLAFDF